jgi:hypothetical protein
MVNCFSLIATIQTKTQMSNNVHFQLMALRQTYMVLFNQNPNTV